MHWSALEIVSSLVHFRYLQLPDGTRLIGSLNFDMLSNQSGLNEAQLNEKYASNNVNRKINSF
jgi:hypothetical protein